MKQAVLLALAATLFAETGLRPRASASDYPARQTGAAAGVGAALLAPEEVKKLFAVDLTKMGYVVVELAIYPERTVDVATRDFLLRVTSSGSTMRPVAPSVIAARLDDKKHPSQPPKVPERVQVYTGGTIGYESGGYNGRRTHGVYTEAGVGVGVGGPGAPPPPPPPPPRSGKDQDALSVQADLEYSALPEGRIDHPVAGYLYFPAPPKKAAVDLTWYSPDGQ